MTLEAIKYKRGELLILDQLKLPLESIYEEIKNVEDGWMAIKTMKVRGAPAIAMVGCLSLAIELDQKTFNNVEDFVNFVEKRLEYLVTARPTAVNLGKQATYLVTFAKRLTKEDTDVHLIRDQVIQRIEELLSKDLKDNRSIGDHGSKHLVSNTQCKKTDGKLTILTHCNTGSLATSGYGTALGVIRSLHLEDMLEHVHCTETRPYNQGARLTAYELVHENIPATLIADSMVSLLMRTKTVSAVVVGADRVASNGDVANKIGTYQLAVVAKHHNIPFYVAAPFSSVDHDTEHGDHIDIEHRPHHELACIGGVRVAAEGIGCWNPAFDITPFELVTGGIITEHGVITKDELSKLHAWKDK